MVEFAEVYRELRKIMQPYAAALVVTRDDDAELALDTRIEQKNRTRLCFGAVQVKKSYVSFHLMPLYVSPALLDGVSPALRARMQGKSCFNFKRVHPVLFDELAVLTQAGYGFYQQHGFVP